MKKDTTTNKSKYYLVTLIGEFDSKADVQKYLKKNGSIPDGTSLVKGKRIWPILKQIFII